MPAIPFKSNLVNRNLRHGTGRTSMRLEPELWEAVRDICLREDITLKELTERAVAAHPRGGRTSAVRVFAISYFRNLAPKVVQ